MYKRAPIALFAYARPVHTRRTLEALAANQLANESDLIIFADAARSEDVIARVEAVRYLARSVVGFRSVTVIERRENFGLARNIIEGVDATLKQYSNIIVLEDDMVTSPLFLGYMNDALHRFKDNEKVMHISGYMYPMQTEGLRETFFLPTASCWGWATWARSWRYFKKDPEEMMRNVTFAQKAAFNLQHAYPFWNQVRMNALGIMNTWAIFWYASILSRGGLCLHPRRSYVQNIGHDDSGTNATHTKMFDVMLNTLSTGDWCNSDVIDAVALERLRVYLYGTLSLRSKIRLKVDKLSGVAGLLGKVG